MKAFIHQPGMYDIELKKGHTFRYDIWFGGEPPPNVTWEREGTVIQVNTLQIQLSISIPLWDVALLCIYFISHFNTQVYT